MAGDYDNLEKASHAELLALVRRLLAGNQGLRAELEEWRKSHGAAPHVPLWNFEVTVIYTPRRVECPRCGVKVERMPWNEGNQQATTDYMLYLARWARRLSWKETARIFRCRWERVRRSVESVVRFGLAHQGLHEVEALGIDEIHWGKGKRSQNYLTVIYSLGHGAKRLLWCGQRRTEKTLKAELKNLDEESQRKGDGSMLERIKVVCADMWKPYLQVVAKPLDWALNVLDPFPVAKHLNAAVDQLRRGEQSRLKEAAKKEAKSSRFLLLKRGSRVRGQARARLKAALGVLKDTAQGWALKESFRHFWK